MSTAIRYFHQRKIIVAIIVLILPFVEGCTVSIYSRRIDLDIKGSAIVITAPLTGDNIDARAEILLNDTPLPIVPIGGVVGIELTW